MLIVVEDSEDYRGMELIVIGLVSVNALRVSLSQIVIASKTKTKETLIIIYPILVLHTDSWANWKHMHI